MTAPSVRERVIRFGDACYNTQTGYIMWLESLHHDGHYWRVWMRSIHGAGFMTTAEDFVANWERVP